MPVKPLPPNADLNHLKHQAKDLLNAHAERDPQAVQRIREFHPRFERAADITIFNAAFKLADAQLTIARECGFASWPNLKRRVEKPIPADDLSLPFHERIQDPVFRRAVDLLDAGNVEGLKAHLRAHPNLVHQRVVFEGGNYFRNPTLLEFVAENPVRRGKLPANIVEIAEVVLEAGAKNDRAILDETLGLVCTGCVSRECGAQIPLINLLCDYGADAKAAIHVAALHGEREAVHTFIARGVSVDLPVAAALGRSEDARRLLPDADGEARQLALALASQFGHVEVVRSLLDAGEDPNRYSPGHSHSTPLHQAAGAGHLEVVRLLVERGARLDMKDILWQGTPLGWARHAGKTDVEHYLLLKAGTFVIKKQSPKNRGKGNP